jgi:hypothetical protein
MPSRSTNQAGAVLAVGARKADLLVVAGVELAGQHQLHGRRVALLLRERQGQELGGVVVLQRQLGLEVLARRVHGDAECGSERQHQRQRKQEPNLADQ